MKFIRMMHFFNMILLEKANIMLGSQIPQKY